MEKMVGKVSDFGEGAGRMVSVDGKAIAVFKIGGKLFAIDELCPHAHGPLHEGAVENYIVECPWHGSQFDIRSGRLARGPSTSGVNTYRIYVKGEEVFVDI
ncbi:MAG: non-heme iron oxygenase ferredoxin subunit [Candidatus Micrarchaeota archaeon]|nr:non-heme iron oxygenase ferredoxin subunit [Candidatus Micrarchaeota archaeon]MDE1823757.1 non-heme iron oxygenase ferredoxin subunit [Candidatus Micrarchaeota archaeon]MDE1849554.1 non-heme iron oxygenase ferredoxin subunit [Candidatus Micrarchaeota archaeon]